MFTIVCAQCGQEAQKPHRTTRHCSPKCSNKARYKDPLLPNARWKRWYYANRDRQLELSRKRYQRRREDILATARRNYRKYEAKKKAKLYGTSLEFMQDLLKVSACQICGDGAALLHTDHCHVTNVVRGRICQHCNRGLGAFKDSPELLEAAILYLRDRQEKKQ